LSTFLNRYRELVEQYGQVGVGWIGQDCDHELELRGSPRKLWLVPFLMRLTHFVTWVGEWIDLFYIQEFLKLGLQVVTTRMVFVGQIIALGGFGMRNNRVSARPARFCQLRAVLY